MSVNVEAIREWVSALRSGEYEQTKSVLHDSFGYCCLGVACEVFRRHQGGEWVPGDETQDFFYFCAPNARGEEETLPDAVRDWLGVDSCDPIVSGPLGVDSSLSELNDTCEWDFPRIATAIESALLSRTLNH